MSLFIMVIKDQRGIESSSVHSHPFMYTVGWIQSIALGFEALLGLMPGLVSYLEGESVLLSRALQALPVAGYRGWLCLHVVFSSIDTLYPQSSIETLLCAHHLYRYSHSKVFCFLPLWKALGLIQPDTVIWNLKKSAVLKVCIMFVGFMDWWLWF